MLRQSAGNLLIDTVISGREVILSANPDEMIKRFVAFTG